MMKTAKKFMIKEIKKLFILFVAFLVLKLLSMFPYFNLILDLNSIFVLLSVLAIYLFKLKEDSFLVLSIILLAAIFIALLLGDATTAETIGNYIFFLLVLWFGSKLLKYTRRLKSNS